LLPPKARQGVGQVGKDTVPARKMLEKLGFTYQGVIDPFDGGPHLQAVTDDIPLVRATETVTLGKAASASACKGMAIVSTLDDEGEYVALQSPFVRKGDTLCLPKDAMAALHASEGDMVACTVINPMPTLGPPTEPPTEAPKTRSAHKKKPTAKKSRRKKTG
jgi:arginine/ornithine N-succinyltransferase beta subunit